MAAKYSEEPRDGRAFTRSFDRAYTRFARAYDAAVKILPVWKGWLRPALAYLTGPRILEVSIGTGYLLTQYADRFEAYGLDLNPSMIAVARGNLRRVGMRAALCRATVEALPYEAGTFDCVLNTMAFSGYPNGKASLGELVRVLKPGGRLVIIDIDYPSDRNWLGTGAVELWKRAGDLVRDLGGLLQSFSMEYRDREIGGWGSVHLYVATKPAATSGGLGS